MSGASTKFAETLFVVEFPKKYPCSPGNFCQGGCCHAPALFSTEEMEEEILADGTEVFSKEYVIPSAPTKLAGGRYKWNDDTSGREYRPAGGDSKKVELRNEAFDCRNDSKTRNYHKMSSQTSDIPPYEPIFSKSDRPPPFQRTEETHHTRIVRKVIKDPRGTKTGEVIERDGTTEYYINNKKVSREQFNREEWF